MSLVSMKALLDKAYKNKYAVPAINVSNLETIIGAFEAAFELRAPIILQIAPIQVNKQGSTYEELADIIKVISKRFDVDYAIHGDHMMTIEECQAAVDGGFTSVMFDGSAQEFSLNCDLSREARNICNVKGITLEGELGHVGGTEGEHSDDTTCIYTDVNLAKEYVEKSGVDCLAIAIGNAHGFYKGKPELNFEILEEINKILKMPLVLHGGTGIANEDIKKSISLGISKINFFTEVDYEFTNTFAKEVSNNSGIYMIAAGESARNSFKEKVKEKIKVTMSEGRLD